MTKNTTEKKTVTDAHEELKARIDDTARRTFIWIKNNGCTRPAESEPITGYFIIERSTLFKHTGKPVWTEAFNEKKQVWQDVMHRMLQLGFPICSDSNGHYLGIKGEQGSKIGSKSNDLVSRHESTVRLVEAIMDSGEWKSSEPFANGRFRIKDANISKLLEGFQKAFLDAGIPVQMTLTQYLLSNTHDDDVA